MVGGDENTSAVTRHFTPLPAPGFGRSEPAEALAPTAVLGVRESRGMPTVAFYESSVRIEVIRILFTSCCGTLDEVRTSILLNALS